MILLHLWPVLMFTMSFLVSVSLLYMRETWVFKGGEAGSRVRHELLYPDEKGNVMACDLNY